MPKVYSDDLRRRVFQALDAGERPCDVALRLRVSRPWISKLKRQRRETGSEAAPPRNRGRKAILAPHIPILREIVSRQRDATLEEIRRQLPVRVSVGALHAMLHRLKLTLKKTRTAKFAKGAALARR